MNQLSLSEIKELLKKHYGLDVVDIKPLPSGINYVYLIDSKFVLKDYVKVKSPELDAIHSELITLMKDGLPIPPIVPNIKGEYLTKVNDRNVDLTKFIDHIDLSDQVNISAKHIKLSAETLFKIHAKLNTPKISSTLQRIDFEKKIDVTLKAIDEFKTNFEKIVSKATNKEKSKLKVLKELVYKTDVYRERGKSEFSNFLNLPFKPTHGDYSMVNVLISQEDNIFIIDWDSLNLRPIIWDLQAAISLFSLRKLGNAYIMEPDYKKARLFLESYLNVADLTKAELELLPEVVKYNFAIYWLSYTLPAVNEGDFRLLFLIPDTIEEGLYWIGNLNKYIEFVKDITNNYFK